MYKKLFPSCQQPKTWTFTNISSGFQLNLFVGWCCNSKRVISTTSITITSCNGFFLIYRDRHCQVHGITLTAVRQGVCVPQAPRHRGPRPGIRPQVDSWPWLDGRAWWRKHSPHLQQAWRAVQQQACPRQSRACGTRYGSTSSAITQTFRKHLHQQKEGGPSEHHTACVCVCVLSENRTDYFPCTMVHLIHDNYVVFFSSFHFAMHKTPMFTLLLSQWRKYRFGQPTWLAVKLGMQQNQFDQADVTWTTNCCHVPCTERLENAFFSIFAVRNSQKARKKEVKHKRNGLQHW